MSNRSRAFVVLTIGVACIAGCNSLGHDSPRQTRSSPQSQPTGAVTPAQEADMQIALGRVAEQRGDLDEAMAAYLDALKRDKHRADAYQRIAVLYDRQGNFRQSGEMYRMALAADPGNPEIYCDMGYSLFLQRRWAESEQNFRQVIVLRPNHARAHNNLGLLLAYNHRDEEALAEYRKAGNNEAEALSNLAVTQTIAGRLDEAREQYQRIISIDESSPIARSRLKELDTLISRFDKRSSSAPKDERLIPVSANDPGESPSPRSVTPPDLISPPDPK
jgi:Tfp pilus assembly protein PilF